MKCPECSSPMRYAGTGVTLVGYQSPPGHNHDDNCRVRVYHCIACSFAVAVSKQNTCPACDWRGKTECFCHPGPKVSEWPEATQVVGL